VLMLSMPWSTLRLRYSLASICSGVLLLLLTLPVAAQGNSAIAQQFQANDPDITAASLVSIVQNTSNTVELSKAGQGDRLAGVVSNESLIQFSDSGSSGVQVVTSGLTMALVSNLNGDVMAGDKITVSPIEGVGMRAAEPATIVGTAQTDLISAQSETKTIKNSAGEDVQVRIGLIQVQVGVAFYTPDTAKDSSIVPSFLQELANKVRGRDVSPVRVLIAMLILLLLFLSVTVLLYSSIRSSIISIGRNPLSQSAVRKSLLQVGLTVIAILVFAVATIYLVLVA
jgi:hypothetical protein